MRISPVAIVAFAFSMVAVVSLAPVFRGKTEGPAATSCGPVENGWLVEASYPYYVRDPEAACWDMVGLECDLGMASDISTFVAMLQMSSEPSALKSCPIGEAFAEGRGDVLDTYALTMDLARRAAILRRQWGWRY